MFIQTLRRMTRPSTLQRTRQVAQHMSSSSAAAAPIEVSHIKHRTFGLGFVLSSVIYYHVADCFVRVKWLCSAIHPEPSAETQCIGLDHDPCLGAENSSMYQPFWPLFQNDCGLTLSSPSRNGMLLNFVV